MPNIRDFSAPQGIGLNPTEIGVDATAGAARRIGAFYNQTGEALSDTGRRVSSAIQDVGEVVTRFEDHREISAGSATGTNLMAAKISDWNTMLKGGTLSDGTVVPKIDPNDPSAGPKFLAENLEPALEKWKSGFNTENSQKWAEQFADQLRRDMFHKTAADMSTQAGIAVQQNARTTVNSLSSAVASDPSSLDFALKTADHTLGGMADSSPNLTPEGSARVKAEITQDAKESIVKAAISGMITKNPNMDLSVIEQRYGEFLKPGEIQTFQKAAQTQVKVNAVYDRQTQLEAKQQADLKVHTTATKTITDNVSIDPQTGNPIIKPQFFKDALELARQNPDAPSAAATARTMIDWGESQQNKEGKVVDDPVAKRDLTDRLFDPDHPTTRIDLMKAQTAGKISDHTFQSMERLVTELETSPLKGPVWQTTTAAVKDALIVNVPGLPGKDVVGTTNYSTFMQTFVPQYLAKSRAGTLPPNALDVKDPNSMISQAMTPFKRTQGERMKDYVSAAGGIGAKPEVPTNQSTRMIGDVPVPAALNGVASLQFNKSTKQFRDQANGTIYDAKGVEVK